jgi:periplasmic protein TonB
VPAVKPPKLDGEQPKDLPKPELSLTIPAITTAAADLQQIGIVSVLPTLPAESLGPGTGGGPGNGKGRGSGSGEGPGLNEGKKGGSGGGPFGGGAGVVSPRLIKEVKPEYTPDAMRAKVQGVVAMEAVVLPDGSVGRVQIVRSLDSNFGLDQEAVRTVRQWRFAPGTMSGQPVPVLVEIEMAFTLR